MTTKDIDVWKDGTMDGLYLDEDGNWIYFKGEMYYKCIAEDGATFEIFHEEI